jgi:hypothetical protein
MCGISLCSPLVSVARVEAPSTSFVLHARREGEEEEEVRQRKKEKRKKEKRKRKRSSRCFLYIHYQGCRHYDSNYDSYYYYDCHGHCDFDCYCDCDGR